MEKKQTEIIITAGLAVVLLFSLSNSIKKIKQRMKKPPAVVAPIALPKVAPSIIKEAKMPVAESGDWIRCPFSGKVYTTVEGKSISLKLSGILWDDLKPQALINNSIVQQGDFIGDYKVIKINKDNVLVSDGNKDFALTIGP